MRLKSLDSLRGVAALIILVHHALIILPGWGEDRTALLAEGVGAPMAWLYLTPLRLLVCGPAAVLMFFVLSGLVLAMAFIDRDGFRYTPFMIRRIVRIWLPFAVVIVTAAALTQFLPLDEVADTSAWFANAWREPASIGSTLLHLSMTGTANNLDYPMWSLVHQVRVSLIFPLLVGLTLWSWPTTLLGGILCSLMCVKAASTVGVGGAAWSLLSTGIYLFLFILGITIAIRLRPIRHVLERSPRPVRWALWIVALVGICACPMRVDIVPRVRDDLALIVSGCSAALAILLCVVEGRALQILLGPIPRYLGRISYSLYLLHVVVLLAIVHALHGLLPLPLLLLLGVVASVALADLFQRCVEVPTAKLGHGMARRLGNRERPLDRQPA